MILILLFKRFNESKIEFPLTFFMNKILESIIYLKFGKKLKLELYYITFLQNSIV